MPADRGRDNIVDGALYKELPTTTKMSQGAHLGILLDLDTRRLEFYVDKAGPCMACAVAEPAQVLVSEVTDINVSVCIPAFYTRTRSDRLSLLMNPSPPLYG